MNGNSSDSSIRKFNIRQRSALGAPGGILSSNSPSSSPISHKTNFNNNTRDGPYSQQTTV